MNNMYIISIISVNCSSTKTTTTTAFRETTTPVKTPSIIFLRSLRKSTDTISETMRVKHLLVNGLVLESLESGHLDVLHEAVHLLLGLFVVVALPRDPDADPLGDVAHTLGPHELVKLGGQPSRPWCPSPSQQTS